MASCLRNICAKNHYNLLIILQVTVENVKDFFETQCRSILALKYDIWWQQF